MIKAEALFKRHWDSFVFSLGDLKEVESDRAIIYGACIIAEAIRNDGEEFEARLVPGKIE